MEQIPDTTHGGTHKASTLYNTWSTYSTMGKYTSFSTHKGNYQIYPCPSTRIMLALLF